MPDIPGGHDSQHDRLLEDPATANYHPKSLNFWLVMLSNFVAIFLVALDRTYASSLSPRLFANTAFRYNSRTSHSSYYR